MFVHKCILYDLIADSSNSIRDDGENTTIIDFSGLTQNPEVKQVGV
jgi:hypothetical protein